MIIRKQTCFRHNHRIYLHLKNTCFSDFYISLLFLIASKVECQDYLTSDLCKQVNVCKRCLCADNRVEHDLLILRHVLPQGNIPLCVSNVAKTALSCFHSLSGVTLQTLVSARNRGPTETVSLRWVPRLICEDRSKGGVGHHGMSSALTTTN